MTRGGSFPAGFDTLHTRRSPSEDKVANISDFCFDEDACQAMETIGDGPREVVIVWRTEKVGCNVAINMDPF
jgi:hypothetical protein